MRQRHPVSITLAAALLGAALAGCGGGGSESATPTSPAAAAPAPAAPASSPAASPAPAPAPAAAPAPAGNAARGKALWADLPNTTLACSDCHGDPRMNVNNVLRGAAGWEVIASAIQQNKGGMGALAGTINGFDMQDISAYLANPGI